MSRVFMAEEVSLGRKVVVKVLPPDLGAAVNVVRFRREIHLAARLQHPLIVPVLAAGVSNGLPYYTMPFIEGESLRARLTRAGELPVQETARILRDILSALAYAHEHGVVHRDIKPENVLLTGQHAVVADFGVAKALSAATNSGSSLTSVGLALGTPAYMSPEQAAGDPSTDQRADLYAVGAMAYEMLTGYKVFSERSPQAMLAAHAIETPEPIAKRRSSVPGPLSNLIMRALEKRPADRPQSASEMLGELEAAVTPSGSIQQTVQTPSTRSRSGTRSAVLGALALAAALLVVSTRYWFGRNRSAATSESVPVSTGAIATVAVLPFANTSGNANEEYFSDGMTDELAHALSRLPGLRIAGRTSSYSFKGKSASAQEIGKALDVAGVVEGSVRRAGDRVRLNAQLTSTSDGKILWSDEYESRDADVFAVQDSITKAIVTAVAPTLRGDQTNSIAERSRGTTDPEAYDLFLQGHYLWVKRGPEQLLRAVDFFSRAIAKDPQFARAHAGLALTYGLLPSYTGMDRDSVYGLGYAQARQAVLLDSALPDAHLAFGLLSFHQGRFSEAETHMRHVLALQPTNAQAHLWRGDALLNLARSEEALREQREALSIDPLNPVYLNDAGVALYSLRRFPEAIAYGRRAIGLAPYLGVAYQALANSYLFAGMPDSALALLFRGQKIDPRQTWWHSNLMYAYAAAGRWSDAAREYTAILKEPAGEARDADLVTAAMVIGDREQALSIIERGAQRGGVFTGNNYGCDPFFDSLKPEPRYRKALAALGHPICPGMSPFPVKPPPPEVFQRIKTAESIGRT